MPLHKSIILLLAAAFSLLADAQTTAQGFSIYSKRITSDNGLPCNFVRSIAQDRKGFMWFSTLNGLCRYDGNTMKVFNPQGYGQNSIYDDRIDWVMEDAHRHLWVLTMNMKSYCLDLRTDKFLDMNGLLGTGFQCKRMAMSNDGRRIWLYGYGTVLITVGNDGSLSAKSFKDKMARNFQFIYETSNHETIAGNDKGLFIFDGKGFRHLKHHGRFTNATEIAGRLVVCGSSNDSFMYFNTKANTLTPVPADWTNDNLPDLRTDNKGNCWLYNKDFVLTRIDKRTGTVIRINAPGRDGSSANFRYNVVEDSRGLIWISTDHCGLLMYNKRTGELTNFRAGNSGTSPIGQNNLLYTFLDKDDHVWVSSWYTGISCINVSRNVTTETYKGEQVRMICQPIKGGDIYVGTKNTTLDTYDATFSIQKNSEKFPHSVYSVAFDSEGTQWLGLRDGGIIIGDKLYNRQSGNAESLSNDAVFSILRDSKNRMWITTHGGGLNLAVKQKDGTYRFRHFLDKEYNISCTRNIVEDNDGNLWVSTNAGVVIANPDRIIGNPDDYLLLSVENNKLRSNLVRMVYKDSKGNIWIAETGKGFAMWNASAHRKKAAGKGKYTLNSIQLEHFGINNGLSSPMVQGFLEDRRGNLWVTTEYGISRFNPATKSCQTYRFFNDIIYNAYSECAALELANGALLFGKDDGLEIIANPSLLDKNKEKVVDILFTNISVAEDGKSDLLSLAYSDRLQLEYTDNSFRINFSTMEFPVNGETRYSYRLEGYDKRWSSYDTQAFAEYKNLEPGTYRLHVRAISSQGVAGKESILEITIKPPFYRTWWAYLLYSLFTLAVAYYIYRLTKQRYRLRQRIKVERELTDYKLKFFTNISHEFRTPLTLIQSSLETITVNTDIVKQYPQLSIMERSTNRMVRLINQLLEFRKMMNGKLHLALEEDDIIAFVRDIFYTFNLMAEDKKITMTFNTFTDKHVMFFDKSNVDKVVYNLISNAIKYTPAGGNVSLDIQQNNDNTLSIKVADDGLGVPKHKQQELFSRFMQTSFAADSIGVGLNLAMELVKTHHGSLTFEENRPKGSVFTVTLPTDKSVYASGDFLVTAPEKENPKITPPNEKNGYLSENLENKLSSLSSCAILVVEDDVDIRNLLQNTLSYYFRTDGAPDGESGLKMALENHYDLIVSDVMMPGINGYELTKRLKQNFETCHIPIILLTALNVPDKYQEGIESGADAYIVKPFSMKLLLARIFNLIEQRNKIRERFSNDLTYNAPVISKNDKDKDFADQMLAIVKKNMANSDFSADDFAAEMHLGRSIFYKKVKGVTGCSPMEYIKKIRMKKAAELLQDTNLTIADVTYKVGISDPFYFSKCFKAQFGMAPSAYQKQFKEGGKKEE